MSIQVELDGFYLGQVAMLGMLVCVAVCPAVKRGARLESLVIITAQAEYVSDGFI